MLQNNLVYVTLWFLLHLLIEINCQITPYSYKPKQRWRHTATLIDNKLYILGGMPSGVVGKDFFYLDFSVPLNTQNLLWNDLSNLYTVPSHYGAASVNGGENNNTLILYGGNNSAVVELVYTFNPHGNSWSIPKITGDIPMKKYGLTGVRDNKGKMYLWSGFSSPAAKNIADDMLILDTINLIWGHGSLIGAPTVRTWYGAVLLPNNNIIYMGLYDTINDIWSIKTTSGNIPPNRSGFSAVLGLDGQRIIIFGGTESVATAALILVDPLYELNIINFKWYIPKISGKIPKSRLYHKANVIGNYMVISFGYVYDQSTESDILLLDISNVDEYIWTNEFYPPTPPPSSIIPSKVPSQSPAPPSSIVSSQSATGAIIGSFIAGAILSFVGFFLYRWNKNRNKNDNNNQAEKNIYNHGQEIVQTPNNEDITNHEIVSTPASIINKSNNHGRESIPIANDEIQDLTKQEIQDLRQIIIQNNSQSTSFMNND